LIHPSEQRETKKRKINLLVDEIVKLIDAIIIEKSTLLNKKKLKKEA